MSRGDLRVLVGTVGVREFDVDDRSTSGFNQTFKPGEPMLIGGDGSNYCILPTDGQPVIGINTMVGIARTESTETASANGLVQVEIIGANTFLEGKATTAANVDTAAELLGLMFNPITLDLTGSDWTFDEDQTDSDSRNLLPFTIVAGDVVRNRLTCSVHTLITMFGSQRGQTID